MIACRGKVVRDRSQGGSYSPSVTVALKDLDIVEVGGNKYPLLKILGEGDYFKVSACSLQDGKCTDFKTRRKDIIIPINSQNQIATSVKSCIEDTNSPDYCSKPLKLRTPALEQEMFDQDTHSALLNLLNMERELFKFKIELLSVFDQYEEKMAICYKNNPSSKPILSHADISKLRYFSEQDLGEFVSEFDKNLSAENSEENNGGSQRGDKKISSETLNHVLYGIIGVSAGVSAFTNATKLKYKTKIVKSSAAVMVVAVITRSALAVRDSFQLVEEYCEANPWLLESIEIMSQKWDLIKQKALDYGEDLITVAQ